MRVAWVVVAIGCATESPLPLPDTGAHETSQHETSQPEPALVRPAAPVAPVLPCRYGEPRRAIDQFVEWGAGWTPDLLPLPSGTVILGPLRAEYLSNEDAFRIRPDGPFKGALDGETPTTLLLNGEFLVTGAVPDWEHATPGFVPHRRVALRYSYATGFRETPPPIAFHERARLFALDDGRALLTGTGLNELRGEPEWTPIEVFDPRTSSWTALPVPADFPGGQWTGGGRSARRIARWPNGDLLFAGRTDDYQPTAVVLDLHSLTFRPLPALPALFRPDLATVLQDGTVVLSDSTESLHLQSHAPAWTAHGPLPVPEAVETMTLSCGGVLAGREMPGGYDAEWSVIVHDTAADRWHTQLRMTTARGSRAVELANGDLLNASRDNGRYLLRRVPRL